MSDPWFRWAIWLTLTAAYAASGLVVLVEWLDPSWRRYAAIALLVIALVVVLPLAAWAWWDLRPWKRARP
jgi:hypothetical protein